MIVDKVCNQQILGSLIKHPQFLSEIDKYHFTLEDFSSKFERYIFSAISGLYRSGVGIITPMDIDNYLNIDTIAHKTFLQNNGIEYLQDVESFCKIENFPYYYNKFKKLGLLRDLQKTGIDVSDFYIEDLTSAEANEVNARFESLTVKDIVDGLKKKLLALETTYVKTGEVEVESVDCGMEEFLEDLNQNIEIGPPLQGHIYNQVIGGSQPGALTIRSGSSGLGKALPNSTLVPTPQGWQQVGNIKVGDYLFDAFGKPTKVLNIYPQGIKEVYEVTFKDGRISKCCDEHLWSYCTYSQKDKSKKERNFYTKTLKDIMQEKLQSDSGMYRILVPMNYSVEYPTKNFFIPPYLMGLFLGDGSFRQHESNKSFQYSSENETLPNLIGETMGWNVKRGSSKNYTWYFSSKNKTKNRKINIWVEDVLKQFPTLINTGSKEKFIPKEYLQGDIQQRFDLLNGLLDSDGSVDEKARVSYFTISPDLRDGVVELCRSLGFKTKVIEDNHKSTNIGYIIDITGRPEDKLKLFKLPRKHNKIIDWFNDTKRKESNEFNPIVKIEKCGYSEEMTCFYVDNDEHLFLTNDFIVTHNTRQAVADACYLAYPLRFNSLQQKWEQEGGNEKVLFIVTEQTFKQIRKMILAYLTDMNESRFKYGNFTEEEMVLINKAKQVIKDYSDNFILLKCPNPTIELIKTLVRENVLTRNIAHVFYDYVFIGPSLLNEFRGFNLRNDEILLMFTTALKDLAIELSISMMTSTQVNSAADDNKNIRNEASLAGGRSTINKADNGAVMARPKKEEIEILEQSGIIAKFGRPNVVTDIFKVRSGQWTQVRIWSEVDLGRLKKKDLFITDARLDPVEDFYNEANYKIENWDNSEKIALKEYIDGLNS